jgi:hypothetical protein
MQGWTRLTLIGISAFVSATVTADSASPGPDARAPAKAQPQQDQPVSAQADRVLRTMAAYVGSANQFTFHADITFDHVLPSGQKLQFFANEEVAVQRPDRLYVEWDGDLGTRQFWYDGKSVTLYDPASPFYASASASGEFDGMLEMAVSKLNFSPPLADLLYRDPYKTMRQNVRYGFDLGQNFVEGRKCRTLAFVEQDVDWQIWIENGPQPTPCKLVITYKTQPSQPQFSAVFSDWDFTPRIAAQTFVPELPPGVEKVPFANVAAAQ